MKQFLNILRFIVFALLLLIFFISSWLFVAHFFLKEDLPKVFGYCQAVVVSGSMEPTFSPGDVLIFKEEAEYEVNEIIIFRQKGSFITHRIVGENEVGFVTKGDANNTKDKDILNSSQIEGKLKIIIPNIGEIILFLKTPLGILILIAIGFLVVEAPNFIRKNRGKRVKRQ